jgi:beta-N-acetylhexosaminidase
MRTKACCMAILLLVLTQGKSSANPNHAGQILSLEDKVGQMLNVRVYVSLPEQALDELKRDLAEIDECHAGSVDLRVRRLGENLVKPSPIDVLRTLNSLQRHSPIPLLVGADIERGLIARVAGSPDFPQIMAYGASGDPTMAERVGQITAEEARSLGIQIAFAPVADLNDNPNNPVIGDRSFGDDPVAVSAMVESYIRGAHSMGMLTTAKHFPGHGNTATDSHVEISTVNGSLNRLNDIELAPFRAAIAAGVDAIMLAHVRVPALEPDSHLLASTSRRVIQDYLRGKLGFRGIVISDALEMRGLTEMYKTDADPEARAAVDAVKAGVDVIMLSGHGHKVFRAIVKAVQTGEIEESRIDESVARIMSLKRKSGLFKRRVVEETAASRLFTRIRDFEFSQQVANGSVVLVRNNGFILPMLPAGMIDNTESDTKKQTSRSVTVIFTDSQNSPLGSVFEAELRSRRPNETVYRVYYDNQSETSRTKILDHVHAAEQVVVAVFMTNIPGRQFSSSGRLVSAYGLSGISAQLFAQIIGIAGKNAMVIAFGNPYLLSHYPNIGNYICTFSLSSTSERAAAKALFGEIGNQARLPVELTGVALRGSFVKWPRRETTISTYSGVDN